jgi:benzylsuccinate CoA-transferase BbsF subunit
LQAVDKRSTNGKGARIDLSQFECSASMIGPLLLSAAVNKTPPLRRGNRSSFCAPQGVYRCAGEDNWCAISIETDEQWRALIKVIEQGHWQSDSRFSDAAARMRHHDEIDGQIEAWTKKSSNTEVERRLKAAGVPAERVRRINDVIESEQGAPVFVKMDEPRVGSMLTTRLPFSFGSNPLPPPSPAPGLGENTAEVLHEWLGLSNAEIAAIKTQEALL